MAGAPYEQKYNVLKKAFTHHKGMYQQLKLENDMLRNTNYDLAIRLHIATSQLLEIGYRRLPSGKWTDEPFIDSTLETNREGEQA